MVKAEPKYRRPLNDDQVAVLRLLYRFRFATGGQLAKYSDKPASKHIQKRLKILEDQEYIAKRYDKTYKLKGKPAAYYLTPKGARTLRARTDKQVDDKVARALYKNKTVSEDFIDHCLTIFNVYLRLRTPHGDTLLFFTRNQLVPYGYFPTWSPDAYFRLDPKGQDKQFFLDVFDGTKPFFVSVRKARNYLSYSEQGDWESETNTDLPTVLMLCEDKRNEKKLRRQIRKALDESYEEVLYATATIDEFMQTVSGQVWRLADEEDKIYGLGQLTASVY